MDGATPSSRARASWESVAVEGRLRRAVAALERLADAAASESPVPDTPGWSVGDVFAHLAIESDRYARELEGAGEWSPTGAAIAETNRRELEQFVERSPSALTTEIERNVGRYLERLLERDPDEPTHGLDAGLLIAPRHAAGVLLGELVVHGRDVAQGAGQPYDVQPDDAVFIIDGAWQVAPAFVVRDRAAAAANASIEVRLRGYHSLSVRASGGTVTVNEPVPRPDAIVSADPVSFLLLMYGRRSQWRAALGLEVVAWGRRPDKAFVLSRLFARP